MKRCVGKKCPMCPGACQFKDGNECNLPDAIILRREKWWRRLMWWIQRRQTDVRIPMIEKLTGEPEWGTDYRDVEYHVYDTKSKGMLNG